MSVDLMTLRAARKGGLASKPKGVQALLSDAPTMRKIYIASDCNGVPLSVIAAYTRMEADLFWQGAKIFGASVEELDIQSADFPRVLSLVYADFKFVHNMSSRSQDEALPLIARGS